MPPLKKQKRTLELSEEEYQIIVGRRQAMIDNDNMKTLCEEFAEWVQKATDYGITIVDRDSAKITIAEILALSNKTITLY